MVIIGLPQLTKPFPFSLRSGLLILSSICSPTLWKYCWVITVPVLALVTDTQYELNVNVLVFDVSYKTPAPGWIQAMYSFLWTPSLPFSMSPSTSRFPNLEMNRWVSTIWVSGSTEWELKLSDNQKLLDQIAWDLEKAEFFRRTLEPRDAVEICPALWQSQDFTPMAVFQCLPWT